jgi:LDH2 family malate/lactate/ureidoglycolate dehydrogenase
MWFTRRAAREGFVALLDHQRQPPRWQPVGGGPGEARGHQPLAIAAPGPTGGCAPLTSRTSAVARGKIYLAAAASARSIPSLGARTADGAPTNDPAGGGARRGSCRWPGGHRGTRIAFMMDVLRAAAHRQRGRHRRARTLRAGGRRRERATCSSPWTRELATAPGYETGWGSSATT